MDLKYLKTFRTIIAVGSFQRAAEVLNYSQSTITFQVQQLEQRLRVKLFERVGRKMVPTFAARELLPHIDTVLEELTFIENYGKAVTELTGELKVAMPESFLTYQSPAALQQFREDAPEVRLSLQTQNCLRIREQVMNGQVDFGVHYNIGREDGSVVIEKLADYKIVLVCAPLFEERDFMSAHQRKRVCVLTDSKLSIFFSLFWQYLAERDIVVDSVVELGSIEAIKRSVMSNVGIAMLPLFTVAEEIANKKLETIETQMKAQTITAVCAYHKNKWINPSMRHFMAVIKQCISG